MQVPKGSFRSRTHHQTLRDKKLSETNPYNFYAPRTNARNNDWSDQYFSRSQYNSYRRNANLLSLSRRAGSRTNKKIQREREPPNNSHWAQKNSSKKLTRSSLTTKSLPSTGGVQDSLRDRSTVKKATLASPRWTRSRGEHKKKKQFIVANWGGLGLGNGLGVGLTGTTTDSYDTGLNTRLGTAAYGTGLSASYSNDYGAGLGTLLAPGYGTGGANVLGSNAVLDPRHNFGSNYGGATTSNGQSQTALSDLSSTTLNSLSSPQAGGVNSLLSNLGETGGVSDLSSMNSLSSYQNNGLDMLGNTGNTASTGLDNFNSLSGELSQSQQLGDGSENLLNSLEEKLNMGAGGRQGIGGKL